MSGRRWELSVASKGKNGKYFNTRVGVVFEGDKGQLQIKIDPGVSVSTPEGVLLTAWLPKEREEGAQSSGPRGGGSSGGYEGAGSGSDDIPF